MNYRQDFIGSRCRQCGHKFDELISRCPSCGFRTGVSDPIQEALRDPLRHRFGPNDVDAALTGVGGYEPGEIDLDHVALAPPVELPPDDRPWFQLPKFRKPRSHPLDADDVESAGEPAGPTSIRSFSLETLMVGMTIISVCLAFTNLSRPLGFILLAVCVPAFVRTLSAARVYERRLIRCSRHDLVGVFAQSLLVCVMPLPFAGMIWFPVDSAIRMLASNLLGITETTIFAGITAAIAAMGFMIWMVLKVWPIEPD